MLPHTNTKIVCTIGPSVNSPKQLDALIQAGMNVARINFSHGSRDDHKAMITMLKEARARMQEPLAIMLDTKGPEVRLGELPKEGIAVKTGDTILISSEEVAAQPDRFSVVPLGVLSSLPKGTCVLFDDGLLSSHVVEVNDQGIVVAFDNEGTLYTGKGVNVPSYSLDLPAVTPKDKEDIEFGCLHDIDFIAVSFVRHQAHFLEIKHLTKVCNSTDTRLIAKIENEEALNNFDDILQVADGVMVARGDLGVELPISRVPSIQKMIIRKCYDAGKPSITATQMLDSMMNNPRPTRAEASDVANAIYDSTSMVMLSGETAIGKYPIKTVEMMRCIIAEAEADFDYQELFYKRSATEHYDTATSIAIAGVHTAYNAGAKAIFCFTTSGRTARLVSRLRPGIPILTLTSSEKTYHQLGANWGVTPFLSAAPPQNVEEAYQELSLLALQHNFVTYGDMVIVAAGSPFGIAGTTNMMLIKSIGDVLVRGYNGAGNVTEGKILILAAPEEAPTSLPAGTILVLTKCDASYEELISQAAGVILETAPHEHLSENYAMLMANTHNIPTIVRAEYATGILSNDQTVTLNPQKCVVYDGVVKE